MKRSKLNLAHRIDEPDRSHKTQPYDYEPTVGQFAEIEELLGTEKLSQLLSLAEIDITFTNMLKLYGIIEGESDRDLVGTPIDEVQRAISFFFARAAALSNRARKFWPAFLLLTITSEQIEEAISLLRSQYPGMTDQVGRSLDGVLQAVKQSTDS